jgi:hypothetical protein
MCLVASKDAEEQRGVLILGERAFVMENGVAIIWNRRGGTFAIALVA